MSTIKVSEQAIRALVREALDGTGLDDTPVPDLEAVNVNPVVDPSQAVTNPNNPNYVPDSRVEFDVAIKNLVKDVPDEYVPNMYKSVVAAKDDAEKKSKEDEHMDMKKEEQARQAEALVRRAIKGILGEAPAKKTIKKPVAATPKPSIHSVDPADLEADEEELQQGRKFNVTADVGGATFEEIAEELGFSVAGAKQAVDKAILKMRFLMLMDEDEREIMILSAMNDYIKLLTKSGELAAADVQLLKDHPEIVRTLDGFREFLHNYIRRARKDDQKLEDPLGDD